MYICRLFHKDQPFEQIDARVLAEGQITIGRDPGADWTLADVDATLSRLHCTLAVTSGGLSLSDTSTNGTFLDDGVRAPRDGSVGLQVHDAFHLGALTILIDEPEPAAARCDPAQTLVRLPVPTAAQPVPSDWIDPAPGPLPQRDGSLIEAFCEGAKLDASALLAQDPAELMRRAGAIYQQTVLGLATLMAERSRLKAEYDLDRTTIRADDNNPFKWAPSRRLAQDLLSSNPQGFLSDVEAVRACFADIGAHMAAIGAGADMAAAALLETLSPESIEAEASERGFTLRGRAATCWEILNRRHARLASDDAGNPVRQAFVEAYGRSASAS